MHPQGKAIGVDIGGTWTRIGLASGLTLLSRDRFPTPRNLPPPALAAELASSIRRIGPNENVPIGIAVPGLIDPDQGRIRRCVNLPELEGDALNARLAAALNRRVALLTDAEAATWGEYIACHPRPGRFVHLRFGTGVACGILLNGALVPLDPERTTHWRGLIAETFRGVPCPCGLYGCLEAICSGRALELEAARRLRRTIQPQELERLALDDDPTALEILGFAVDAAHQVMRSLANTCQPDVLCLGGGLLEAMPLLWERLLSGGNDIPAGTAVSSAVLADDAGVIGAAAAAMGNGGLTPLR